MGFLHQATRLLDVKSIWAPSGHLYTPNSIIKDGWHCMEWVALARVKYCRSMPTTMSSLAQNHNRMLSRCTSTRTARALCSRRCRPSCVSMLSQTPCSVTFPRVTAPLSILGCYNGKTGCSFLIMCKITTISSKPFLMAVAAICCAPRGTNSSPSNL